MTTASEHMKRYVEIFKKLDRATAAELMTLVASDPQVDSKSDIGQAAVLVSFGHGMGWLDSPPKETP
jgi:hypothetical protein